MSKASDRIEGVLFFNEPEDILPENEEDVTFRKLIDFMRNHDVPQHVRVGVAEYVGTMNAQSWHRGLVTGLESRQ